MRLFSVIAFPGQFPQEAPDYAPHSLFETAGKSAARRRAKATRLKTLKATSPVIRPLDLIHHQRDGIGKDAHVADRCERPFCIVHFALDGAHGRKAGGAEQVENHEAPGSEGRKVGCDRRPDFHVRFLPRARRSTAPQTY